MLDSFWPKRFTNGVPRRFTGTLTSVSTHDRIAALTFDDGPDPETTPVLLDLLADHDAKATFFVVGTQAQRHPDLLRRIVVEGHELANHTSSHPELPRLSFQAQWREIQKCHDVIRQYGRGQWFRPPYGYQTRRTVLAAQSLGYRAVTWSGMAYDWLQMAPDMITQHLDAHLRPGSIFLLHDRLHTVENERARDRRSMLSGLSSFLRGAAREYDLVTLSTLVDRGHLNVDVWRRIPEDDPRRNLDLSSDVSDEHERTGRRPARDVLSALADTH